MADSRAGARKVHHETRARMCSEVRRAFKRHRAGLTMLKMMEREGSDVAVPTLP